MRYFLKALRPDAVLPWLLDQDAEPRAIPVFPTDAELALVVTQLLGGAVFAEVVTSAPQLAEICGPGFPLGRLYFQIPKSELYRVCPELNSAAFEEGGMSA